MSCNGCHCSISLELSLAGTHACALTQCQLPARRWMCACVVLVHSCERVFFVFLACSGTRWQFPAVCYFGVLYTGAGWRGAAVNWRKACGWKPRPRVVLRPRTAGQEHAGCAYCCSDFGTVLFVQYFNSNGNRVKKWCSWGFLCLNTGHKQRKGSPSWTQCHADPLESE